VNRPKPVHSEDVKFLRSATTKKIKFTLPAP
jgi:methionine synthase II (cobalamin-independent)